MTRMSNAEKQQFLAGLHVGVLSIAQPGRGPLTVPVWYDYTPGGDLWFLTGADSRKGRLLQVGGWISLCAQTETPPYQYVSVEGQIASIEAATSETQPMAIRYLGEEMGRAYAQANAADGSVVVRMQPKHWLAVDYSKGNPLG